MTTDTPARLLTLLSLLQTPREWPGGELADRLGVSRRTVRQSMWRRQETYEFSVTFDAPAEFVAARLPGWLGVPEPVGDGRRCRLRGTGGDSVEWMAVRLAMVDCEFV